MRVLIYCVHQRRGNHENRGERSEREVGAARSVFLCVEAYPRLMRG